MGTGENTVEPRWAGVREVMAMSWPIILGSFSYVIMDFTDKMMSGWLGAEALAAGPSAGLWSFTLSTLFLGILSCVSTFVGQCEGRGEHRNCGRYTWQGLHISLLTGFGTLLLWPFAGVLFDSMNNSDTVKEMATGYFQIRLLGYVPMAWTTVLAGFFQATNRQHVPMWIAMVGCALNIGANFVLMYGLGPFPEMGIYGLATGTVFAQYAQMVLMTIVFFAPEAARKYHTRTAWAIDFGRIKEFIIIGLPNGITFLFDILNWAIFTTHIVGRFGDITLSAHNAALGLMHLAFMPAVAINNGIAAIVGQWVGRGRADIAEARTYTAIRIAMVYMAAVGILNAYFGEQIIRFAFNAGDEAARVGHGLLMLAVIFQAFDAINIVTAGALRGAGDTRWMMWLTMIGNYTVFLPSAIIVAIWFDTGAFGGWSAATCYIIALSGAMLLRFRSGHWRNINIFREKAAPGAGAH